MSEKFKKQNIGKEILNDYLKILESSCADFVDIKLKCDTACKVLREEFKDIDKVIRYNEDMLISSLEFAFEQGINDNLRHFRNPENRTFIDNGYDGYINEKEFMKKSDYAEALYKRHSITSIMPIKVWIWYDAIIEYQTFLDTYIPKMAHYYGFSTGNTTLQAAVKGYVPDYELTNKYKKWLSEYLELNLE